MRGRRSSVWSILSRFLCDEIMNIHATRIDMRRASAINISGVFIIQDYQELCNFPPENFRHQYCIKHSASYPMKFTEVSFSGNKHCNPIHPRRDFKNKFIIEKFWGFSVFFGGVVERSKHRELWQARTIKKQALKADPTFKSKFHLDALELVNVCHWRRFKFELEKFTSRRDVIE